MNFWRSVIRDCVTLDFETDPIEDRPVFPPKPCGLAVRYPDGYSEYMAWGHPSGNNTTEGEVRAWLEELWYGDEPLLFFNAKFDLAILLEYFGLSDCQLPWHRVHDAQFLCFLADPHSRSLGLKPLSDDLLGWPPEERDEVARWIYTHRVDLVATYGGKKITQAKGKPGEAAKPYMWFSKVPGQVLAPYGIGDVDRTFGLFEHLLPIIAENNMLEAYDRERQVLPIFMANERDGIHVDLDALSNDVPKLENSLLRADEALRGMLDAPELNIDADAQLAEALTSAGMVDDDQWILTPSKQKSVSKVNLKPHMFNDPDVALMYYYRNRLTTALSTFLKPWLRQAEQRDGIISTNWNQVRGDGGGTRTGRPSTSNPNFLNIPKEFKQDFDMKPGNNWELEALPYVRYYVLPDPGELFMHRDFDGQEMRVFAHYECGALLKAYQENPHLDPHEMIGMLIAELKGETYDNKLHRGPTKTLNFLGLYGGGARAAQLQLECTLAEAQKYIADHNRALPGKQELNDTIASMTRIGEGMRTWGGRLYYPEPKKLVKGRMMDFGYKMINVLCQGSAADITKEAMIRYDQHPKREARFLVTVYDEINASTAEDSAPEQMGVLKECMESIELDLEMTSSGKIGPRWGELEECD